MFVARHAACLVVGLAVLAACSKPAANATAQAASQQLASTGHDVATSDTEMPTAKPGLWEINMRHASGAGASQGGVTRQCLDESAITAGKKTAADYIKANCSHNETHGGGGTWVNELVCKTSAGTTTTHTVTTMTGENAYHTELTTTYDPPVAGRASSTTTVDGKWIGACQAS